MVAQIMDGQTDSAAHARALVSVSGGVEIPALLLQGRNLLARLFNARGDAAQRTVSLEVWPLRVDLVELEG